MQDITHAHTHVHTARVRIAQWQNKYSEPVHWSCTVSQQKQDSVVLMFRFNIHCVWGILCGRNWASSDSPRCWRALLQKLFRKGMLVSLLRFDKHCVKKHFVLMIGSCGGSWRSTCIYLIPHSPQSAFLMLFVCAFIEHYKWEDNCKMSVSVRICIMIFWWPSHNYDQRVNVNLICFLAKLAKTSPSIIDHGLSYWCRVTGSSSRCHWAQGKE